MEKLKKEELVIMAKELNLKVDEKMTKKELIDMITEAKEKEVREATPDEIGFVNSEKVEEIAEVLEENEDIDVVDIMKQKRARLSKRPGRSIKRRRGILRIDGGDAVNRNKTREEMDFANLTASLDKNYRKVLRGRVDSIRGPFKHEGEVYVFANIMYGTQLVTIPGNLFLPDWDEISDGEKRIYMSYRLNQETDFVIIGYHDEGGERTWIGSRLDAMESLKNRFWWGKDKKGNYLIKEGDVIEGKVNAVTQASCFIEAFGVEDRVRSGELAYEYIVDANDYFRAGDRVNVRVMEVKRENGKVSAKFSVKLAGVDPMVKFVSQVERGDLFTGEVSVVRMANDGLQIYVNVKNRGTILCRMARNVDFIPSKGDMVSLVVRGKSTGDDGKAYIWGEINHVDVKRF